MPTEAPIYYPLSMWGDLSTGGLNSGATSLRKAARIADLVIVGRWVGLERDKGYGEPGQEIGWYATALLEVDQVLKWIETLVRAR